MCVCVVVVVCVCGGGLMLCMHVRASVECGLLCVCVV